METPQAATSAVSEAQAVYAIEPNTGRRRIDPSLRHRFRDKHNNAIDDLARSFARIRPTPATTRALTPDRHRADPPPPVQTAAEARASKWLGRTIQDCGPGGHDLKRMRARASIYLRRILGMVRFPPFHLSSS